MSLSNLNTVTCRLPLPGGANVTHSKLSKVTMVTRQALPLLQVKKDVKEKETVLLKAASRREMMQLTAATLGLLSIISPASAEARTRNPTVKQRILEKFEKLRRKAGLSKPKEDEDVDNKPKAEDNKPRPKNETEDNKSNPKNEAQEKKPLIATEKSEILPKDEPSIPALPQILNGNTIEATLP